MKPGLRAMPAAKPSEMSTIGPVAANEADSSCYYLAYGSNMDPTRIRIRLGDTLCDPDPSPVAAVTLHGYKVAFRKRLGSGSAAADLARRSSDDPAPPAEGVIWRVSEDGISRLDLFEGVGAGHYRREHWRVSIGCGGETDLVVYRAEPGVIEDDLRPSAGYLQHLLNGAHRYLSPSYADWLQRTPTTEDPYA